jgi:hypothetical protein
MRFLTPELFVDLNSSDEDVVGAAEDKWETGRKRYRKYFRSHESDLPKSLVRLCKTVALHDARIGYPDEPVWILRETSDKGSRSAAVVSIKHQHADFDLFYLDPIGPTRLTHPIDSLSFYGENVVWLYDEVSLIRKGVYAHEILFSNGSVLMIKFKGFKYVERPRISTRPPAAMPLTVSN